MRALYAGFTSREHDALRLLRKGGIPDSVPLHGQAEPEVVSPQELKGELAEIKNALMDCENMLALYVKTHSAVSPDDAKTILKVRELIEHTKLLMSM